MANKAMKEAQKTLDSALEIAEEQSEDEKTSALWTAWKSSTAVSRTESSLHIADKSKVEAVTDSAWGSFSGSFFDAETVVTESVQQTQPVSSQPKRIQLEVEEVTDSSSSVLGGVEEGDLVGSWEEDRFTSSRLVVQERETSASPEVLSPSSVELISSPSIVSMVSSPSIVSMTSPPNESLLRMLSVELHSSQSSAATSLTSSVELVSPSCVVSGDLVRSSSLELVSSSASLELVSPPSTEVLSSSVGPASPPSNDLVSPPSLVTSPSVDILSPPSLSLVSSPDISVISPSTVDSVPSVTVERNASPEPQFVVECELASSVSSGQTVVEGEELGDRLAETVVEGEGLGDRLAEPVVDGRGTRGPTGRGHGGRGEVCFAFLQQSQQ